MKEQKEAVCERIIQAAAKLLAQGGRGAASTRTVSAAAGVQAPVIYRHFGDMEGLLQAAAQATFVRYVRRKAARRQTADDPLEALRQGWDQHVAFGLENPVVYSFIYGDPAAAADSPTAQAGGARGAGWAAADECSPRRPAHRRRRGGRDASAHRHPG